MFLFEQGLFRKKPVPTHRVVARGHAFADHAPGLPVISDQPPREQVFHTAWTLPGHLGLTGQ